jgi:iron complex outermembrane receptor protein
MPKRAISKGKRMSYRAFRMPMIAICVVGAYPAHSQSTTQPSEGDGPTDIIVTGTRQIGVTAAESATPIKLVGQEMIEHVGQPNLNDVLAQLVPSFSTQSFGTDASQLTLSSALRGLNPNHTLVLVNGKRRHGTGNLQVGASPSQGGAAPDLDYIPTASIDHIEVLESGAAAQYGSDAIGGVINIILKNKKGGAFSATGGQNYTRGGRILSSSLNYGLRDDNGYLNVTVFYRDSQPTYQGDQDIRVQDVNGNVPANYTGAYLAGVLAAENFPIVTRAYGKARSKFGVASFNFARNLTDNLEFYSFGSLGFRNATSFAGYRLPGAVVSTGTGVYAGGVSVATFNNISASNPSAIFAPNGFTPTLNFHETDFGLTAGIRGTVGDWRWDLSTSYGDDHIKAFTRKSVNANLFVEQGLRQRDFYDGAFYASEWTNNLDISRDFGTLATLAFGAEYRQNLYGVRSGEPNSYYKTGASSYPGFAPISSGDHTRNNHAVYGDITLTPVSGLKVDGAVRYEHYSDFGSATNWALTGRYDFTPEIAIRGTVQTGFRAPTLAEENYTQVAVGPAIAVVVLAANSAAAKVLGIQNLRPEKSTSYSAGFVLRPAPKLTVTVDAYQIDLRDRIVGTTTIFTKSAGFNASDLIYQSIAATGFDVTGAPRVGVSALINGPDTRTRGVDFVASYTTDSGSLGRATFTLSGAYLDTKITKQAQNTAVLQAYGTSLTDPQSASILTTTAPKLKVIGGINWTLGKFSVNLRETYYSKAVQYINNGVALNRTQVDATGITDLELGFQLTKAVKISAGAQNLFDKRPNTAQFLNGALTNGGATVNAPFTYGPYGINGGYWYGRLDVTF